MVESRRSRLALTPASLCLIAFPIGFLLMPDGVPFVYAGCGNGLSSSVTNMRMVEATSCEYPNHEVGARVWSYTLDNTLGYCQFKSVVDFTVFQPDPQGPNPQCNLVSKQSCGGTTCDFHTTTWIGPFDTTYAFVSQCNTNGEEQRIWFEIPPCFCAPGLIFDVRASSSLCFP